MGIGGSIKVIVCQKVFEILPESAYARTALTQANLNASAQPFSCAAK